MHLIHTCEQKIDVANHVIILVVNMMRPPRNHVFIAYTDIVLPRLSCVLTHTDMFCTIAFPHDICRFGRFPGWT